MRSDLWLVFYVYVYSSRIAGTAERQIKFNTSPKPEVVANFRYRRNQILRQRTKNTTTRLLHALVSTEYDYKHFQVAEYEPNETIEKEINMKENTMSYEYYNSSCV